MKLKSNPEFLNEKEVAAMLRVSLQTVRKWRYRNQGPKCWKIGNAVKYTAESVNAFVRSCPAAGGNPIPHRPRPFKLDKVPVPADLPAPPSEENLWDPLKVAAIMTSKLTDK